MYGAGAAAGLRPGGGHHGGAVDIEVTYEQQSAREMLAYINEFRTGSDAWVWNKYGAKVDINNLSALTYDYTLEQVAMQRAAEIAMHFDHTRPNGNSCFTAFPASGYTTIGENIAAGQNTAWEAFTSWQETNEDYSGQGHRRNMLNENFNVIGIGHVVYNGVHYWTHALGYTANPNTTQTAAASGAQTVTVVVDSSQIVGTTLQHTASPASVTLRPGETAAVPTVTTTFRMAETWPSSAKVTTTSTPAWTVGNTGVAAIAGGQLKGVALGSTTLQSTVNGTTVSVPVTVVPFSLQDAQVSLSPTSVAYNGKAQTPAVTVIYNGKTLTKNTDYTVSYQQNTAVGTAKAIVTGQGNYNGVVERTFTITACSHSWNGGTVTTPATCTTAGVRTYTCTKCGDQKTETIATTGHSWDSGKVTTAATCTAAGVKTYTCTTCGATKTETIAATGHKIATQNAKAATCAAAGYTGDQVCTVCGVTVTKGTTIAATGHSWDSGKVTTAATCTAAGVKTYTCTACGATKTEAIAATGHKPTTQNAKAATCAAEGYTGDQVCTICGVTVTKGTTIAAKDHSWDSGKVTTAATCTAAGVKTYTCTTCGATKTETIAATGHKIATQNAKAATCTAAGYTGDQVCTVCGVTVTKGTTIAAKGHSWDSGKVTTAATATTDGVKTYTCTACSATRTEKIPATGAVTPTPTPVHNCPSAVFTDVDISQYYHAGVDWAVLNGVTNGTSATTFSPGATCTRAQVVTFLWRAKGSPEPQSTVNPFTDVKSSDYYYKAVLWAVEKGITNGTSATAFSPADQCTRAHVVTFLWRTEGKPAGGSGNPFGDVPAGAYYTDAVLWAVARGITNGTSATTFSPGSGCTRAQVVTFLYRDLA